MPDPIRMYRFADAPPALQALSEAGGDEHLVVVVPRGWLDQAVVEQLHVLWLLLAADTEMEWPSICGTWGTVQRAPQEDGSVVVITS